MSKYIDSEKLIAEIERLREEYNNSIPMKVSIHKLETKDFIHMGIVEVLNKVLLCAFDSIIQQERPSIPSNLDEAAEEYAREKNPYGYNAFKAGAEWMAGQGESREVEVKEDAGGYPYITKIELYDYDKDEPLFNPGKVVVQIRKIL